VFQNCLDLPKIVLIYSLSGRFATKRGAVDAVSDSAPDFVRSLTLTAHPMLVAEPRRSLSIEPGIADELSPCVNSAYQDTIDFIVSSHSGVEVLHVQ
jgi:hypothetical protein